MEVNREKAVMEAAIQAGHLLLENGAEISRVKRRWSGAVKVAIAIVLGIVVIFELPQGWFWWAVKKCMIS